jgi:hypothetical protein
MHTLSLIVLSVVSTPFLNANTAKPKIIDDGTVIKNVTVISPERSRALPNAVVVIRGGRIAEIGTNLVADTQANQIDGHGGFLISGLIDSHVRVGNMGPLDDEAIEKHPELLDAHRGWPATRRSFDFGLVESGFLSHPPGRAQSQDSRWRSEGD